MKILESSAAPWILLGLSVVGLFIFFALWWGSRSKVKTVVVKEKDEAAERALAAREKALAERERAFEEMKEGLKGVEAELRRLKVDISYFGEVKRAEIAVVDKLREAKQGLEDENAVLAAQNQVLTVSKAGLEEEVKGVRLELGITRGELAFAKESAATAFKRMYGEGGKGWRLEIDGGDREDIERVKRFVKGMACENAVKKALYECYWDKKLEEMVRAAGVSGVSGIYRIWYEEDGKEISYVGQSVDVGNRWKQHLKRAVGIDDVGRIVLYDRMDKVGIWNFHWELVEKVEKGKLGEREVYWGEFYCVKELGLNKKLG